MLNLPKYIATAATLAFFSLTVLACDPPPPEATDEVELLENSSDTLNSDSVIIDREKTVQDEILLEGYETDTIPRRDSIK